MYIPTQPQTEGMRCFSEEQVQISRLVQLMSCNILQLQSRMYDKQLSVATETSNLKSQNRAHSLQEF